MKDSIQDLTGKLEKRRVENTITECVKKGHPFPSGVERRGLFGEGKGICLTEGTFKEE